MMENFFINKNVVVTAGTYGIGRAIVERFINAGANVATCARSKDLLAAMQKTYGKDLYVEPVDLLNSESIKSFIDHVTEKMGPIDVLVFNPPHSVKKHISELDLDDWQLSYEALYKGMIGSTNQVLPSMLKRKVGSVIVVSSIAAIEPIDRMPPSSVFRGGIAAWVKLMAREFSPQGVRFNAVMPGFTETPAVKDGIKKSAQQQDKTIKQVTEELAHVIPLRRIGKPEEVANAVMFLASDQASYINGTSLLVDGGMARGV